jgi:hypothetical protein
MSRTKIAKIARIGSIKLPGSDIDALLGPPPLLPGEDRDAYWALLQRVRTAIKPEDTIEELWLRDLADLAWESLRLRRLKAKLIGASAYKGVQSLIRPIVKFGRDDSLAKGWAAGDPESVREVDEVLAARELDREAISAQTLAIEIDSIERIDRILADTEARRNSVLREIERRRAALAQRVRDVVADIEDAEFEEVEVSSDERRQAHRG